MRTVYLNSRFVAEAEARLSIYDSALTMGDMAFEVTRTYHHRPYRLDDHLARLFHSLGALRIDPGVSPAELNRLTLDTLARNLPTEADDVDWSIIHNVSRGPVSGFAEAFSPAEFRPTVVISCFPLTAKMAALAPIYDDGVELVIPPQRALPHELLDLGIKTRSRLHYQLANLQAHELRVGSVPVMVDPAGHLTETTSGNVFAVVEGRLQTPRPHNLLPGITRDTILRLADHLGIPADEIDLTPDAARAADELFITSTSIGVIHARSLDDEPIGNGRLGSVTARLRAALCDEVGLDFAAQARSYAARRQPISP